MIQIGLISPEKAFRQAFEMASKHFQVEIYTLDSQDDALELMKDVAPQVLLMDQLYWLPLSLKDKERWQEVIEGTQISVIYCGTEEKPPFLNYYWERPINPLNAIKELMEKGLVR